MNPRELDTEISMDGDERKVAELLGSLKRVEAPANFEFGVRARIAAGAPSEPSSIFRLVKIAAPLTLVLLVGAAVFFFGNISTSDVPAVADSGPAVAQPEAAEREVPSSIVTEPQGERASGPNATGVEPQPKLENLEPAPSGQQLARRNLDNANSTRRAPKRGGSLDAPMRGGSQDIGLGSSNVIDPTGSNKGIPVGEVFGTLGIQADFVNNGWRVRSATQGSVAQRSGFQAGDVIESIDGLAVTDKTSFKGGFNGKTFSIRRGGKPMEIKLGN